MVIPKSLILSEILINDGRRFNFKFHVLPNTTHSLVRIDLFRRAGLHDQSDNPHGGGIGGEGSKVTFHVKSSDSTNFYDEYLITVEPIPRNMHPKPSAFMDSLKH